MAVVSKEELLNQVKEVLGENISNEALALIENVSDTLDDKSNDKTEELNKEIARLKEENETLDKTWRQKYTDRFFNGDPKGGSEDEELGDDDSHEDDENEPTKFEDLFSQD